MPEKKEKPHPQNIYLLSYSFLNIVASLEGSRQMVGVTISSVCGYAMPPAAVLYAARLYAAVQRGC